jgi:hypothetical protein
LLAQNSAKPTLGSGACPRNAATLSSTAFFFSRKAKAAMDSSIVFFFSRKEAKALVLLLRRFVDPKLGETDPGVWGVPQKCGCF